MFPDGLIPWPGLILQDEILASCFGKLSKGLAIHRFSGY
jgi:hypothetical protein